MAERRMFTKKITDSDAFIDMPLEAQALYFHLGMHADDDGFINSVKKIVRMIGASEDTYKLLMAKNFLISFDSGVVVVKHWKMHNYIQKDRYKPTDYIDEKALLALKSNKVYTLDTNCIQDVPVGKVRLGKDRLDYICENEILDAEIEEEPKPKKFSFNLDTSRQYTSLSKEYRDKLHEYILKKRSDLAQAFYDYHLSKGTKYKDWSRGFNTWCLNDKKFNGDKVELPY